MAPNPPGDGVGFTFSRWVSIGLHGPPPAHLLAPAPVGHWVCSKTSADDRFVTYLDCFVNYNVISLNIPSNMVLDISRKRMRY